MSRWRDIKQGNIKEEETSKTPEDNSLTSAPIPSRIKAFLVDMFMIMMPIMYVTTYLIMDGKDDFQSSQEARWITAGVFGLIIIVFWIAKGQTPGYKAYSLKLIDNNTKNKISLGKAILRYFLFLFSATTILLAFIPFFRKDKKTIQDILSNSTVVEEK
ncbi:RDD family protein [Halarcobacter sp.]|uniref:RDD family protein n=1 Tax=Halarcobacter sp. TaxID=2321133 RepID=UPI002AA656B9|nr:RDD family protein [Halarcobacter sp.]